jgi:hypothetical protein
MHISADDLVSRLEEKRRLIQEVLITCEDSYSLGRIAGLREAIAIAKSLDPEDT